MSKIKVSGLTAFITIITILVISLFSPYNFIQKLSEESVLSEQGVIDLFVGEEIVDVDYKGSNTYIITTSNEEFVAIKDYYSVMNYKWFIYEKVDEWG